MNPSDRYETLLFLLSYTGLEHGQGRGQVLSTKVPTAHTKTAALSTVSPADILRAH